MDCRETHPLLTAFHDGELPAAERVRVEEHLRGCPECAALLDDLERVDRATGVPDPGPAYWDRFNARVMDRVERKADGPGVTVLRPNGGWMRQQLRYLVPAAAAAALVVVIVHFGGMRPGGLSSRPPPAPPAVSERTAPVPEGVRTAMTGPEPRATQSTVGAQPVPPPAPAKDRFAAVTREERDRLADRSPPEGNEEASRDRAAAPAASGEPSPPPMTFRTAPGGQGWPGAGAGRDAPGSVAPAPADGSPPVTGENGIPSRVEGERKKLAASADGQGWPSAEAGRDAPGYTASARMAERQGAGKAESASGTKMTKEPSTGSPCELARTLAAREFFRDAEVAQRACLAQDRSASAQEKGLVFLAELLDRQVRFAEADEVIAEVDRQFPQSRPLDHYRRQRPMVQQRPTMVPVTR